MDTALKANTEIDWKRIGRAKGGHTFFENSAGDIAICDDSLYDFRVPPRVLDPSHTEDGLLTIRRDAPCRVRITEDGFIRMHYPVNKHRDNTKSGCSASLREIIYILPHLARLKFHVIFESELHELFENYCRFGNGYTGCQG